MVIWSRLLKSCLARVAPPLCSPHDLRSAHAQQQDLILWSGYRRICEKSHLHHGTYVHCAHARSIPAAFDPGKGLTLLTCRYASRTRRACSYTHQVSRGAVSSCSFSSHSPADHERRGALSGDQPRHPKCIAPDWNRSLRASYSGGGLCLQMAQRLVKETSTI